MTRSHHTREQEDTGSNHGGGLHGEGECLPGLNHQLGLPGVAQVDGTRQGGQGLLGSLGHPLRKTGGGGSEQQPVADVLNRAELMVQAREAFTRAMQATAVIAAVILLGAGIMAARRVPATSEMSEETA